MVDAIDELGRGRESYARRAWMDAYRSLSQADQAAPLGAEGPGVARNGIHARPRRRLPE